jgi:hypothetical protein
MKMFKVALVLLVLASFAAATTVVSMAATADPVMAGAAVPGTTMKLPDTAKMPTKKPGAMIDLAQMQSNIGNVFKMLKNSVKMPGDATGGAGASVKSEANKMVSDTYSKIAQGQGKALSAGLSAPQTLNQLGGLPQIGNTRAKIGPAPGANLMISLGL